MYQCIIIVSWKKYALQEYSNWSPVSKEVPKFALTLYKELQNLQKSEVYRFAYLYYEDPLQNIFTQTSRVPWLHSHKILISAINFCAYDDRTENTFFNLVLNF